MRDPYEDHDDDWNEGLIDDDSDRVRRDEEPFIPYAALNGQLMTQEVVRMCRDFPPPPSHGTLLTFDSKMLSQLGDKKRERILHGELVYHDIEASSDDNASPSSEALFLELDVCNEDDLSLN